MDASFQRTDKIFLNMSYINVVMSLMDFIPYISNIVIKNNGALYIEKKSDNDFFSNIKVDASNYENIVEKNREKNLNFFISSKELEDSNINFYDDTICLWMIEAIGGRETKDIIERIALRIISKKPQKETVKIFNAIKNKLKKDTAIGMGVEGGSFLHKNYFYQKSYIGKKVFLRDINNKSSVIKPL